MKSVIGLAAVLVLSTSGIALAQQAGEIRLGREIPASIVDVGMMMALDDLKAKGYTVEVIEFQGPEPMMLALQNGEVDVIGTSVGTAYSAIEAGVELRTFLGMAKSDFQLAAKKGLATCADLDGKNLAIHSREGTAGVLVARWLQAECPTARPNIMIVPGSENRIAGLLAGQIDAAPVDSGNTVRLLDMKPDEFSTIDSFSKGSTVMSSAYVAKREWLDANGAAAKDLAAALVAEIQAAKTDRAAFVERAKEALDEVEPALVEKMVDNYFANGFLSPVWGVGEEASKISIDFYSSARPYQKIKTPADVTDAQFTAGLSD